ncbi:MAG TPA: metallophosphoesterase, partial [Saprospiraceae bacterium]|nr:metallophosphoesterase [Saprospiraceae bacterium]
KISADDEQPGTIMFLGDNIYPAGLVSEADPQAHSEGIHTLSNQVEALKSYKGNLIYIPGNHDWSEFKPSGLQAIQRQDQFFDQYHNPKIRFLPDQGCSGPAVVELNADVVLLILDSQWWIERWKKIPGINQSCPNQTREAMLRQLEEELNQYRDRLVLIAMHHPMKSRGPHGGHFTFRDHLFPLTKVVKWLYLPLPVIGSIYPGYRTIFGHPEDLKNPRYKSLQESLLKLTRDRNVIFLSGHDHNLQYLHDQGQDFIISGAGAKQNALADGGGLVFGHKAGGFIQLDFYHDHTVELTFYEVDPKDGLGKAVFSQVIRSKTSP